MKTLYGNSFLDTWKAYKREYITRNENIFKSEINELNEIIRKFSSEKIISSGEIEEKYVRDIQELTSKLKKEHEEKKKLAEILNKFSNREPSEELTKKYNDCKYALQESNSKIFNLEQEIIKYIQIQEELNGKINKKKDKIRLFKDERLKLNQDMSFMHKRSKELTSEKDLLNKEIEKISEILKNNEEESESQKEEKKSVNNYISKLEKELFEFDFKLKEKENKINALSVSNVSKIEYERVKENYLILEEQYNSLSQLKDKILLENKGMQSHIEDLLIKAQNSDQALAEFKNSIEDLKLKLQQLTNENENLEKVQGSLIEKRNEHQEELNKTLDELNNIQKSLLNANLTIKNNENQYEFEKNGLIEKISEYEEKLTKKHLTIQEYEKKNKEASLKSIEFELIIESLNGKLSESSEAMIIIKKKLLDSEKNTELLNNRITELLATNESLDHKYNQNQTNLTRKRLTIDKIKNKFEKFCKDNKIEIPLNQINDEEALLDIFSNLSKKCEELISSKSFLDKASELLPNITDSNIKLKYLELVYENSLLTQKNLQQSFNWVTSNPDLLKNTNLKEWIIEKWQKSMEDSDKLRRELIMLTQELEMRIQNDTSYLLENALGEISLHKKKNEKYESEIYNCEISQNNLLTEIDFLKKEHYDIEKRLYEKISYLETNSLEWKTHFIDIYNKIVVEGHSSEISPISMRNEMLKCIDSLNHTNINIDKLIQENSLLLKLNEKYSNIIKDLSLKCEYLEENLDNKVDAVKDNAMLQLKITELMHQKEFLEEKLQHFNTERNTKINYEEKNIREALENELLGKCDLVQQLAEEIEKYKKFLKMREYEYQELLTLKDEEILRLRLKTSWS